MRNFRSIANSSHSEYGSIETIVLRHARDAFVSQANLDRYAGRLNYNGVPEFERALEQYNRFARLVTATASSVVYLPPHETLSPDSIYVRDALLPTRQGVILCNMGKELRREEPTAAAGHLREIGIPILGTINDPGRLEGGDVVWLDDRTLVVGQGYRTNDDGIAQLRELTTGMVDDLVVVPLPHWEGPNDVFHLMSVLSPLDRDLVLVYSRLLPVRFRQWLLDRGMQLVEVPDSEFESMGCNVLAVAPRRCVMLAGNPVTKGRLEVAAVDVTEYEGSEISHKGAGGPTCLTRPLLRLAPE
ncbi:MAG: arginine deiminase family protein [bacterium]